MKLVIIGGVAGGASAAARARRLDESAEIVMFERGEHVSFANCGLPYHIGGVIEDREKLLVQTPEKLSARYGIDVRVLTEVTRVDRDKKVVHWRRVDTGETGAESYDKLILSPGAAPVRPPFPGVGLDRVFTLRNLADTDRINGFIQDRRPRRAVVVGGGYIGLEMVENLVLRGLSVTLLERLPQVLPVVDPEMAAPLHQILRARGVDLRLGRNVVEIAESGEGVLVKIEGDTDAEADFVIMSVGVRPEVGLAKEAGLRIGESGGISVDERMRTDDPDIYAVGDAVEQIDFVTGRPALIPLAGPANRQGRVAADNVFGRDSVYRRGQGTGVVRLFDYSVAMTGLNEKKIKEAGIEYDKTYVHPMSHASYYPGASPISLKLMFSVPDGLILGACATGADGAEKRVDVIATAQRGGMSVFDLEELELCYSPQHGSAKDPVNVAGFVASNMLRGDVETVHADQLDELDLDQTVLLDVRTAEENEIGSIPGSVLIPVDELRQRKGELPKDKKIVAYCGVGLRAYLACRQLGQEGFDAANLSGGYRTYCHFRDCADANCSDDDCGTGQSEADASDAPAPGRSAAASPDIEIDACGLQCPGPIMQVKNAVEKLRAGQRLRVAASDPGFLTDLPAWCQRTGHRLLSLGPNNGAFVGLVEKAAGEPSVPPDQAAAPSTGKSMVVFSGDFDRVMASFVIANGAAAMGDKVTMFFTFWGLNALRRDRAPRVKKGLLDRVFGRMMPRGANRLKLSKMHMGGMGTALMKRVMKSKNVASLPELVESARAAGVRLVACTMSMDVMGIKREELIDGVEFGGVAAYLQTANTSGVNLFV